jgi:hypothetical protein
MQSQLVPDCWKVVAENCFVVDLLALSAVSKEINEHIGGVVSMRRFQFKELIQLPLDNINQHPRYGCWCHLHWVDRGCARTIMNRILQIMQHTTNCLTYHNNVNVLHALKVHKLLITKEEYLERMRR